MDRCLMTGTVLLWCLQLIIPTALAVVEYRLIEGSTNSGILQVKTAEMTSWGTVCALHYDINDATVMCRSLGLPDTDVRPISVHYNDAYSPVVLNRLDCKGYEQSLTECPNVAIGVVECPDKRVVRVYCAQASENSFRLIGGNSLSAGRVELFRQGVWGTVNMKEDRDTDAEVLCRSLGFPYKMARVTFGNYGIGRIWLNGVLCKGNESSLFECQHDLNIFDDRAHYKDASVSCEDLRLVNRTGNTGVLEGYYWDKWRPVYISVHSNLAASVACRVLGLPRSGAEVEYSGINRLSSDASLILAIRSCRGYETKLTKCAKWIQMRFHKMVVTCKSEDLSSVKFRLSGLNSGISGRLEVFANGNWGTICNYGVTNQTAALACRTLGLPSENALVVPSEIVGEGKGDILMQDLRCKSTAKSLMDCDFNPWGIGLCNHWDDLGIYCGNSPYELKLRLVDGADENSGRVQVFGYGVWYRLCKYNPAVSTVICRQLGKPSLDAKETSCFDEGTEPSWSKQYLCHKSDSKIQNCAPVANRLNDNCQSVRVICSDEYLDDSKCFKLDTWVYVVICIGAATVLIIVLLVFTIKYRTGKCRRREASQRSEVNSVRMTNIPANQNAGIVLSPPPYSDAPPTYDALFGDKAEETSTESQTNQSTHETSRV